VLGRAQIEAVLRLSAEGIAGLPHPGKKGGEIGWHGCERGTVCLRERKLRLERPRLRKKGQGQEREVAISAYEAMQRDRNPGGRMLEILLHGVSPQQYGAVLPEMAETVGVSRPSVSREARRRRPTTRRAATAARPPTAALPSRQRLVADGEARSACSHDM
jgi:putative transposase